MAVIVYTKPHCLECNVLKRFLDDYRITYKERDCSLNSAYMDEIKEMGFLDVPVTVVDDTAIQGLQPDRILAVLERQEKDGDKNSNSD
ncbi:glutaredoxin domain-containing protein [Thermoactinomyces mirandus]|uniref:Glutaredoxin family protein n=1 Tax=Thermoactinomyces mirandus TaxID=2756294 RepID=A0A7W1XT33_9BACL|nr:glutaredoxin domain-containing protein [Thermoactinomyces mirandus]MBA4602778.1 glutaredoxin family protein [Thermoactinomyces mirandus]